MRQNLFQLVYKNYPYVVFFSDYFSSGFLHQFPEGPAGLAMASSVIPETPYWVDHGDTYSSDSNTSLPVHRRRQNESIMIGVRQAQCQDQTNFFFHFSLFYLYQAWKIGGVASERVKVSPACRWQLYMQVNWEVHCCAKHL